jgi:hypothetical protein
MSSAPAIVLQPSADKKSAPANSPNNLSSFVDNLVGPISEKYCYYFYILSLLAIVFFAVIFVGIIWTGVTKKLGFSFFFLAILYSMQFLLIYLQNRLLYNMCIHSI